MNGQRLIQVKHGPILEALEPRLMLDASMLSGDDTLLTAHDLGTLSGTETLHDFVGTTDPQDYYRFDLAGSVSEVTLRLDGLSDHARVDLIEDANSNGILDSGEVLSSSFGYPGRAASIMRWLDSGVWYLRAYPNNP